MISLEQVRALEDRVEKAVAYIARLREEGVELGRRLAEAQSFIDEAANELAAAEEKTRVAEEMKAAAERRAEAAEALRLADVEQVRRVESRLSDMAERVAAAETKAAELSARAEEYRKDQAKIEEGIVHALEKLDSFEDLVLSQSEPAPAPEGETAPVAARKAPARAGTGLRDAGIAVKSAPDAEGKAAGGSEAGEALGNELDIF